MRRLLWVVCGVALLAVGPVRADDKAEAVIAKAVKALGGKARLEKFKAATWKGKGTFHLGDNAFAYTGEWAMQAPGQIKAVVHGEANGNAFTFIRVLDGDKGWTKRGDGEAEEMNEEMLGQMRRELWIQAPMMPAFAAHFKLTPLGESKVGDRPVVGVKAAKGDKEGNLYFHKDSGLLLETQTKVKDMASGEDVQQVTRYDHYKEVDGVKRPMKVTVTRDGKPLVEQEVTEFRPLEKLDAKVFAKP